MLAPWSGFEGVAHRHAMYTFVIIGFKCFQWQKDPNIKFLSEEDVRSKLWHNVYSGYVRFKTTAVSVSIR